ncbi:unnamed protein product [Brassica rapa]|uniref:Uncharacterized protein n=1 Tax=Brassica campestris TaxID=3711 RepID=A0A8D9DJB1_BRACM|nr:unnamed protein product [Brassica rapa]
MRDHVFCLFRLSMKAVVKEASVFMIESDANAVGEQRVLSCKSRNFECSVLFRVLSWLASQLAVLYGEGNGKFFALDMLKECVEVSASQIMLFRSPESSGVLKGLVDTNFGNESVKIGKTLDSGQVLSVSRVAAAVAALYERSMLEAKIRAIRYAQPLRPSPMVAEHGVNYRPIIDHDGLPRQRLSNQNMNKMKTREELLADERDYKRRRMSYRGKKVKRTPRQVLQDMIKEFTEVKLAGGIGCFEKGMPLHSLSSIGNDQKERSGMRNMIQVSQRDNIVTDHTSAVIEEMMNSQGPNDIATKGNLIIKATDLVKRLLQITRPKGMIAMTAAAIGNIGIKTRLKIDTIHLERD